MTKGKNPKSVKEIMGLLIKSPELRNFAIQYIQFKIKALIDSYCRVRWKRVLVKEVFWKRDVLFIKVFEPSLKRELSFHSEEILNKVRQAGFKFKEIKFL